jgi:hypothetical protein
MNYDVEDLNEFGMIMNGCLEWTRQRDLYSRWAGRVDETRRGRFEDVLGAFLEGGHRPWAESRWVKDGGVEEREVRVALVRLPSGRVTTQQLRDLDRILAEAVARN